jgi:recombination protein RecR
MVNDLFFYLYYFSGMYLSKSIENLVNQFSKLPGVGKKTAFRYTMHFLNNSVDDNTQFANSIVELKEKIKICKSCMSPNDDEICILCSSSFRNKKSICVVESYKDLIAIENTQQFSGVYHVLGGIINPMDGIGPNDLNLTQLVDRVNEDNYELIMALNPTIEGDTTIFYITKLLKDKNVKITTISRGIAFGAELEYTDDLTLGRSIHARQPYDQLINK